jgi:hypothetical protein
VGALVALVACSDAAKETSIDPDGNGERDAASPPRARGEVGPICGECQAQPQRGGETNDFEGPGSGEDGGTGSSDPCVAFANVETISLEQAAARGFDVEALRALIERDFDASFAWQKNPESPPIADQWDGGGAPSGYLAETSVHGSVHLTGTVEHTTYDPERCDFERGRCAEPRGFSAYDCFTDPRGSLRVPIDVELSTQDGALSLTTSTFARPLPSARMRSRFWVDLATLEGKLRLAPSEAGPFTGRVDVRLYFHDDGIRGTLAPSIVAPRGHRPLLGRWPSDDCDVEELPIVAGSAEAIAAEQQLADVYSPGGARQLATQWSGHPAPRDASGGRTPLLDLEPSSAARPRCLGDSGALAFDSDVRLVTSDGFLDWSTPVRASIGANDAAVVTFRARHDLPSDDAAWAAFPAFRFFGATLARADLSGSFVPADPEAFASVGLRVSAVPACSEDRRCSSDTGDDCEWCGQPDELLRLESVLPAR